MIEEFFKSISDSKQVMIKSYIYTEVVKNNKPVKKVSSIYLEK